MTLSTLSACLQRRVPYLDRGTTYRAAPQRASLALGPWLSAASPALLHGVRLWAAVCLALFVAFRLEMESPYWAGTSAAIVCQPLVGASLRKGWFRLIGTIVGAIASVVLSACFPQSRFGFLIGLAVWGGICALVATLFRNFASYAAALAGYTAAIIVGAELGAAGGTNGDAFNLAVTRASEICIGIASAGIVLASTDLGGARRRLATMLATLAAQATVGLVGSLSLTWDAQEEPRALRRALIRRVTVLHTVMDHAAGEISGLPFRPRVLQAAVDGSFTTLSNWRVIETHLGRSPASEIAADCAAIQRCLPPELRSTTGLESAWPCDPLRARDVCWTTARHLVALPATTPSLRLLADHAAEGLIGISRTLAGVILLDVPHCAPARSQVARLRVPDLLPALLNATRAFLVIACAELVWIATAWPSGPTFITWAALTVILFAPREDAAFSMAANNMIGSAITAVLAAVAAFAILPQQSTFFGFCGAIGFVLVPAGALAVQPWRQPIFEATAAYFIPLLAPTNPMTYDPGQFYNMALAVLGGIAAAVCALRVLPPLSPETRARRLLALTLRDLRRLANGPLPRSAADWEGHVYGRLSAMPDRADLQYAAQLAAALLVGAEIFRLRRVAARFYLDADLQAALQAISIGDSTCAIAGLDRFDAILAALPPDAPGAKLRLHARGTTRAISEALARHSSYFDGRLT
jgi:uncharacterized membrane protein YccC